MRKLISFLAVVIGLLAACSRNNDGLRVQGEQEISYTIGGVRHEYKGQQTVLNGGVGVFATRIIGVPGQNTFYSFSGNKNTSNVCQLLIFMVPPDTLKVKSYHCVSGSGSIIKADNNVYGLIGNSDYLDIAIDSYSNGTVTATFNGLMTKIISVTPAITEPATITNGVIKNVTLKY